MNGRWTDLIFFEFAVECIAADTQTPGGFLFVPIAVIQDFWVGPTAEAHEFTEACAG